MILQIGDQAPDFSLPAADAQTLSLKDMRGRIVVLYFYPKDDTPGCTTQACDFRDSFNALQSQGVTVIGVSKDSVAKHKKFKEKFGLNFPLASDESGATVQAYGVWVEKSMIGKKYMGIDRSTFLIDENGLVQNIWRNVKVPGHVAAVLASIKELQSKKTVLQPKGEIGGPKGPEPTRFGDWEQAGRCSDF